MQEIEQLNEQAYQLYNQGKYEEAIILVTKYLELVRQSVGEQHSDFATGLNNLAMLYKSLGNYMAAQSIYAQALEISRAALGEQHPSVATSLNNLASLYQSMGNYKKAEPLYVQALEICRSTLGEKHLNFVSSLNNLGLLYILIGNYVKAEFLCQQAVESYRIVLGEKHPDFAASLNNLALLYQSTGDYTKAETLYIQTLEICRITLGEQHPDFATNLSNLGTLYYLMGDYTKAENLSKQAVEVYRSALGAEHPGFAVSLANLAMFYQTTGKYEKAEDLCKQAVEIFRATLGEEHPDFATSLNNLAEVYKSIGKYTKAEVLFYQAMKIYGAALGEQHPMFAGSLGNLAALYHMMGNYAKAEPLYIRAVEINRIGLGEKHPRFAASLSNLAVFYRSIGNYKKAETLCQQDMEICCNALGEEHPDFASSLNNLADVYRLMGNYEKAEPLHVRATEICCNTLGKEHPSFATNLNNLALFYHLIGNYEKAEPLYIEAMEIRRKVLGQHHPDFATSLNNLALLYKYMGNYEKVMPLYVWASEVIRIALGESHPDFAGVLNNLAEFCCSMGDYTKAEALCKQVMEVCRIGPGEQHPLFAISQDNLAVVYKSIGNYTKAEYFCREAMRIRQYTLGVKHVEFVSSLDNLAIIYIAKGQTLEGFKLMEQAKLIEDEIIGQVFSISSESQRSAYLKTINLYPYLSLVICYFSDLPNVVHSAFNLILRRKAIQAEVLASQRDLVLGGKYPELEPILRKVMVIRNQIAQRILAGPGKEGLEAHQQFLAEWNLEKEKLETELAKQIPEINLEQKFREVDIRSITMAMPENSVLVEFVRFDVADFKAVPARGEQQWKPARYLAFTIVAKEPDSIQMIDLGEAEPIDQMIATFRSIITGEFESQSSRNLRLINESPQNEGLDVGLKLRETIFDPLISAIGNRKCLLLSPDGDLTRLPFEVLPINDKHLIDLYEISYLAAGRDLLRFGIKSNRTVSPPLVIADPDFDLRGNDNIDAANSTVAASLATVTESRGRLPRDFNRGGLVFTRLQGTKEEGETIASMLGVEPLLDSNALESKLKACKSPRILHIATHGFFLPDQKRDPNQENRAFGMMGFDAIGGKDGINRLTATNTENPLLRSGLALAGANTWMKNQDLAVEAEDGILTAEDVTGLDLLDTELVVLSACETGLGEVRAGEGVFGLRRAFVLAGAKTLVMSLWKVPDAETQEIMTSFYEKILRGKPRGEALRQAQLEMKAKKPNPFFWGAFICQGETSPLAINAKENAL